MLPDDSLRVYGMRLEQMALKAFPDSSGERDRQLRRKFKQTVPAAFLTKIETTQSALSALGKRSLSWSRMMKIAESCDRSAKEKMTSSVNSAEPCTDLAVWCNTADAPGATWSGPASGQGSAVSAGTVSNVYGRTFVRGGGVELASPSAVAHGSPVRASTSSGGGHGAAGRIGNRNVFCCDWCGRRGHTETHCWTKKGVCLLCGSEGHKMKDCSKFKPPRVHRCSLCGGNHLGRDCTRALNA